MAMQTKTGGDGGGGLDSRVEGATLVLQWLCKTQLAASVKERRCCKSHLKEKERKTGVLVSLMSREKESIPRTNHLARSVH